MTGLLHFDRLGIVLYLELDPHPGSLSAWRAAVIAAHPGNAVSGQTAPAPPAQAAAASAAAALAAIFVSALWYSIPLKSI